jgi:hypothetical protein
LDGIRTTFLRLMSHELRTPSIRGYSELLVTGRAGPFSDQQHRMVTMIDLSTAAASTSAPTPAPARGSP